MGLLADLFELTLWFFLFGLDIVGIIIGIIIIIQAVLARDPASTLAGIAISALFLFFFAMFGMMYDKVNTY